MAQQIINLRPTTELEAINAMLSAIGEAPIAQAALDTPATTDIEMAVNLLRNVTRETLSNGWRFNSEYGVPVAPTATYNWTDTSGATTLLNIFKLPAGVLAWKQTACRENGDLDLVEKLSKKYQESNAAVPVLYDRLRHRDGAEKARFPYVYLDTVEAVDFEHMPESARRFATVRAGRLLAEQAAASETLAAFSQDDEAMALRILKREQGQPETFTILDTVESLRILGGRPVVQGPLNRTIYPGG